MSGLSIFAQAVEIKAEPMPFLNLLIRGIHNGYIYR
jgi:hypothetical protein